MEDQTPNTNIPSDTSTKKSGKKLAIIGFLLMLAGPVFLVLTRTTIFYFYSISFFRVLSVILTWLAILLPATGAVFCIVSLVRCKKTGEPINALSIVPIAMCNPFFYFMYFVICSLYGNPLAGISMM